MAFTKITRRTVFAMAGGSSIATAGAAPATSLDSALFRQSAAETSAGVTPANYLFPPGDARRYGADPTGTSDSTTAIQSAINCAQYGQQCYVAAGTYLTSSTLSMVKGVKIHGDGKNASIIKYSGAGDGINMSSTINSSTPVNTAVRDIQIWGTSPHNVGAGYDDVGGTYVELTSVYVRGFKFGAIFDQSELVTVNLCEFQANYLAGVWLVNGMEHTGGARPLYTNRIGIKECQFNEAASAIATSCTISGTTLTVGGSVSGNGQFYVGSMIFGNGVTSGSRITALGTGKGAAGTYTLSESSTVSVGERMSAYGFGIMDDGGYTHTFQDNNYNGCYSHVRVSGAENVNILGGEWESSRGWPISFSHYTAQANRPAGYTVCATVMGGLFIPPAGFSQIDCGVDSLSVANLFVVNNRFGSNTAQITNLGQCSKLTALGNLNQGSGPLYSGNPTYGIISDDQNDTFVTGTGNAFTPSLSAATPGTLSVRYTSRTGKWTKNGHLITFRFNIVISSLTLGTASGALLIAGLPTNFLPNTSVMPGTTGTLAIPGQFAGVLEALDASGNLYALTATGAQLAITSLTGTPTIRGQISFDVAG